MSELISNNMIKITDRLLCYIDYYDENGVKMSSESGASEQRIKIIFDRCESERTESYDSEYSFGESDKTYYSSNEESGHYITDKIYDFTGDVLTNYLIRKIDLKFPKLKLDIIGNGKLKVNKEFFIKAMSNFSSISVDVGVGNDNVLHLPNGEYRIKNFSINGGTIYLPTLFDLRCSGSISFTNVKLYKRDNNATVTLIAKNIDLDSLTMFEDIRWNIDNTPTKDINVYRSSYINIKNIYLNLEKYNDKVFSKKEFNDPLFIITSSNNVSMYNVKIFEGINHKIFKFKGCNKLSLVDFYRKSKSINNYTIGIETTNEVDISGFTNICDHKSEAYAIYYSPEESSFLKNFSINRFNVSNCGFVNLSGCILNSFKAFDGETTRSTFIESKNNNILELSISDCRLDFDGDFNLYGNTLDLRNLKMYHNNKSYYGSFVFEATTGIKMSGCTILNDDRDIDFRIKDECFLDILSSDVSGNNLHIYRPSLENEIAEAMEETFRKSKRKVKINGTTFSLFGDFKIDSEIEDTKISNSKIVNANGITISDTMLSFENVVMDSEHKPIPIEINSCKFGIFSLYTNEVPTSNSITVRNSSGNIEYSCNDITEEVDSSTLNLVLESCRLGFIANSKSVPIKIKLVSNGSKSSCVYGYKNVKVIPDISSMDRTIFTSVSEFGIVPDKVAYGNL